MTDKETELTTKFLDPGFKSPFNITLQQLLDLLHMDNRKEETANTVESSRLIMEEYNGPEGIANLLKTNNETGIRWSSQEKTDRELAFGLNSFPPPKIKTLWELIMENFEDQINQILLGAAIVSIVIGLVQHGWPKGMLEGTSIMIALCIIIIVSSGNNWASEQRLGNLLAQADEQKVYVYRKGSTDETEHINYEQLVVGDLILIEQGMKVPAECMLVSGQGIACKEDALTGEPDLLEKTPISQENYQMSKSCIMFAKTTVSSGLGKAVVLCVGSNTESGRITKRIQEDNEDKDNQTLLQKKLNKIADQIGKVGYGCAIATFIVICIRLFCEGMGWIPCGCQNLMTCEKPYVQQCEIDAKAAGITSLPTLKGDYDLCKPICMPLDFTDIKSRVYTELLNTIIIAITVIVVAIPEGLPLAVTISLSFSSAKMQKENNLVRELASAETMGAVTHICSDKTGTLTQNIMTTMAVMVNQQTHIYTKEQGRIDFTRDVANNAGADSGWQTMQEAAIWNSSAKIEKPVGDEGFTGTEQAEFEYQGNVTEIGIYKFFGDLMTIKGVRDFKKQSTANNEEIILARVPFESSRKRGSIVVKREDGSVRVYTKGAPDVLYGKDPKELASYSKQVKEENPTFNDEQVFARASKMAGHNVPSMVRFALTANGVEDWYAPATIENVKSLDEVVQEGGNTSPDHEDVFKATVKDFARQAYRTILICYKDMSMEEFLQLKADNNDFESDSDRAILESDLVAIGIFGIQDPLRDTIVDSVKQVKTAGIQVIMCTGDNIDTATAISKNAGIITQQEIDQSDKPEWVCMEGKDFRSTVGVLKRIPVDPTEAPSEKRKMMNVVGNQGVFNRVIKHLKVLARSSPEDKLLLVTGLQASPYDNAELELESQVGGPTNYCSVAVTGDGTNDAPALSKADVGFAMGITGTDVAKGACDIILLDDNFASIITALKYGRNIYDNVRKFLQFQLTVNVVAMFIVFFGSVFLKDSPLTAVQMLWVNLIMDTLAALALATEPPDYDILKRFPQPSSKAIVTELMWRNVYGHAIYQMVVLVTILFAAQGWLTEKYDVKCLGETNPKTNECLTGGYNPFFAGNHYIELDTQTYWKETMKTPEGSDYDYKQFNEEAWARFQCFNLLEFYGATSVQTGLTAITETECNKDTYQKLIKSVIAAAADDLSDARKETLGKITQEVKLSETETFTAFTPQLQELGAGTQKLLHMTYVFQIFVFMQIFNQINARILSGGFNIFAGITRNWLFAAVMFFTFIIQMAMVEVGGKVTKTWPLEMYQNGICLIFGCGELFWGVVIKFLPVKFFQCFNFEEKPMTEEEALQSVTASFKKGSRVGKKKTKKEIVDAVGDNLVNRVNAEKARIAAQTAN